MSSGKGDGESIVLTKSTIKRIVSDVKDLLKSPLHEEGIFYHHDEEDILKGYAIICGPKGSLYYGGTYMYTFTFPSDYPHSPPVAFFHTNDGETRFHPNMYKSGKVCLSILNTWKGEPWSGCQTIRSILLTILSVFDDKPFLHEPGITEMHTDFAKYHEIISFKNLMFSSFLGKGQLHDKETFNKFPIYIFKEVIKSTHDKVVDDLFHIILDRLDRNIVNTLVAAETLGKKEDNDKSDCSTCCSGEGFAEATDIDSFNVILRVGAYRMTCCVNWYKLLFKFRDTFRLNLNLEDVKVTILGKAEKVTKN